MDGFRSDSAAARMLVSATSEAFTLLDVGCAGGVDAGWAVFGDRLHAYGFDPSVAEVERLRLANANPRIHYVCGFVGAPDGNAALRTVAGVPLVWRDPVRRLAWWRTQTLKDAAAHGRPAPSRESHFVVERPSASGMLSRPASAAAAEGRAMAVVDGDEAEMMSHNNWHRTVLADPRQPIILPDFLQAEGVSSVDFVKIDTDSVDFEILTSLEASLADRQILAVAAEVNFIGGPAENQHTFHNTDRFMRAQGFDLAQLSVRRYSSSALPFTYSAVHPHYSMALHGRPYQGDAIYVRDFGYPDTHRLAADYSDDKLLKLAAILVMFGRVDQAAELLIMFRDRLGTRLDIAAALDVLTVDLHEIEGAPVNEGAPSTYAEHMARFEADDPRAYGGDWARLAWPQEIAAQGRARAEALQAELDQAREALARVTRSQSWRITAPLRALGRMLRR